MKPVPFSIARALTNYFSAKALTRRANSVYRQSRFAEAALLYQQVLTLRPGQAVIHFNLGLALYKAGRKTEGRAEWETTRLLTRGRNKYLHEQAEIMLRQFG